MSIDDPRRNDERPSPRRAPRAGVIALVIAAVGIVVVVLALVIPQLSRTSANASACRGFARVYDSLLGTVADVKHGTAERSTLDRVVERLPSRLAPLRRDASGAVAEALSDNEKAARAWRADPTDLAPVQAWYSTASDVANACEADGAAISLHDLG